MKTIHWREYVPLKDDRYLGTDDDSSYPSDSLDELVYEALKDDQGCDAIYVYRELTHPSHAEIRRQFIEHSAESFAENVREWLYEAWGRNDGPDDADDALVAEQARLAKLMEGPLEEAVSLYASRRTYPALELALDEAFWVKHADLDDVKEYVQWCVDEDRSKGPLFEAMVMAAHKAALLSEGQVSSLLNLDRISIRTRLEALGDA